MPRRPILAGLLLAALTTVAFLVLVPGGGLQRLVGGSTADGHATVGAPAPAVVGTTLDGTAFDLKALVGKPVILNFWGPGCVPCRDEFPLLEAKLAQHASSGLVVVGVLTDDPVEPAREFVSTFHATWQTVIDPDKAIKAAYRVAARPQSYFIDRSGLIRSIQAGYLTDADFERQFAQIAP